MHIYCPVYIFSVASGIEIHMYLEVGATHFHHLALKTLGVWPEHLNRSCINAEH